MIHKFSLWKGSQSGFRIQQHMLTYVAPVHYKVVKMRWAGHTLMKQQGRVTVTLASLIQLCASSFIKQFALLQYIAWCTWFKHSQVHRTVRDQLYERQCVLYMHTIHRCTVVYKGVGNTMMITNPHTNTLEAFVHNPTHMCSDHNQQNDRTPQQ